MSSERKGGKVEHDIDYVTHIGNALITNGDTHYFDLHRFKTARLYTPLSVTLLLSSRLTGKGTTLGSSIKEFYHLSTV